ncbi:alpha/beta fold hydrolase [Trichocoleus sp. DQ-A3]|nr:alpha/beta fold hydrolase [Coleofasciculus sp. FACHB-125]MBD1900384.1 alpha/beta fold hydrolase [Coleofasciculus sp. FACHB-125]
MTPSSSTTPTAPTAAHIVTKTWTWQGFPICYQTQGTQGPAVVLVHGFGASWGHWRKNIPVLAQNCRVYAIDLIGFGGSAKPTPGGKISYTFETWGQQLADFCREVVGSPVFLVGNSIGCIVAMQAAVDHPDIVLGTALINCSLRLLHDRKRAQLPWYRSFGAPIVQRLLAVKWIGKFFFSQLAKPKVVRKVLLQAYKHPEAVTDELVDMLMAPAFDEGAVDVFVAFTRYSQGPLPEDLLPLLPCPTIILWGTEDPWEPIELGREFANYPKIEKFIPIEGVGHCPQDEAPELVNPILQDWILQHSATLATELTSLKET